MRWSSLARVVAVVVALAVAAGLYGLEREHDGCEDALRAAFLAFAEDRRSLPVAQAVEACPGSETLTRVAGGLRVERPRVAATLAREAVAREPGSYVAWGTLAVVAPPAEAEAAARRAASLNPLSVAGGP